MILWYFHAVFLYILALIVGTAVVIATIEKMPFEDALYFSFVTGLTIGHGDIVVMTPFGRIVAVLLGLISIIFTGMMVAVAIRAVGKAWKAIKNRKTERQNRHDQIVYNRVGCTFRSTVKKF